MFLTDIYKKEIAKQSLFDKLFITAGIIIQVITGIITESTLITMISGISGIFAVVLCAQGRLIQFPFSFLQLITYLIIAYEQKFYGEVIENVFYFITMLIAIYTWFNGYDKKDCVIEIKKMTMKSNVLVFLLTVSLTACLYLILNRTDDSQPLLDAISTVPAFVAQVLLVAKYRENWIYWLIIDITSIVMWSIAGNYVMVIQFIFWSINCMYGLKKWKENY